MSTLVVAAAPTVTLALTLLRPRIGRLEIGPAFAAMAGAALIVASGRVDAADLLGVAAALWRPIIGLASLMLLAGIAERAGVLDRLVVLVEKSTRGPVWRAFGSTFLLSALVATIFNNDCAILVLTPVIVRLVHRRYPLRRYLIVPFAFAVFAAAGVAPLVISNPINYVVALQAGIGFNEYARVMIPVAAAALVVSYAALHLVFRTELRDAIPGRGPEAEALPPMTAAGKQVVALLAVVLLAYPVVSAAGGPTWAVSAAGASVGILLCLAHGVATPRALASHVSFDILVFLAGIFVIARGLESAGAVDVVRAVYATAGGGAQVFLVGGLSALGSAALNNHAVAVLNAIALEGRNDVLLLAALVGGDLGPRLLPIGSLAALLWLERLRREGIAIPLRTFTRVGLAMTAPSLLAALALLLSLA